MVTQEQVNGWLKDPVTLAFMEAITQTRTNLIHLCGSGGCLSTTDKLEKLYHFYQGSIDTAERLADPSLLIKECGLVYGGDDGSVEKH